MLLKTIKTKKVAKVFGIRVLFVTIVSIYWVVGAVIIQKIEKSHSNYKNVEAEADHGLTENNERDLSLQKLPNWSFSSCLLYTFSMLTTIGYGHVSPVTHSGRMFSIAYGLLGVPLTMMMLADMGKFLSELLKKLHSCIRAGLQKIHNKLLHFLRLGPTKTQKPRDEVADEENPILLIVFVYGCWLILGGVVLQLYETEMPSTSSAIYFSFISISTIGFGDITPQITSYPLMAVTFMYILVGIAIMTMLVECMGEYLRRIHFLGRSMPNLRKTIIWFGGRKMALDEVIGGVLKEMNIDMKNQKTADLSLDDVLQKVIDEDAENLTGWHEEKSNDVFREENSLDVSTPMTFDPFLPTVVFIDHADGPIVDEDKCSMVANEIPVPTIDDEDGDVYVEYTLSFAPTHK